MRDILLVIDMQNDFIDGALGTAEGVTTIGFNLTDPKGYNFSYDEIWHTERDTYNKSIPEYQEQSAIATAVILYGLANLDHILSAEGLAVHD